MESQIHNNSLNKKNLISMDEIMFTTEEEESKSTNSGLSGKTSTIKTRKSFKKRKVNC